MREDWKPPADFRRNVSSLYGVEGRAWLKALPALVADCTAGHGLTAGEPYRNLSYNFVVPVDPAGSVDPFDPVGSVGSVGSVVGAFGAGVLKIAPPGGGDVLAGEAAVLRVWDGDGVVRLYDYDPRLDLMFIERADPGDSAVALGEGSVADDREATAALAASMRALWRPVPDGLTVPSIAEYAEDFDWYLDTIGTGGPIPADLMDTAYGMFRELTTHPAAPMLLHGDLHHDNLLRATRGGSSGWLAIDPKGVSGDPGYETAALLWNPDDIASRMTGCSVGAMLDLRLGVLADELDGAVPGAALDRDTLRRWGIARGVLTAVWDIQDGLVDGDTPLGLAVAAMLGSER